MKECFCLRRQRIGNDAYDVQEMNGMHIIHVYTTVDEITDKIQSKLGEEAEKFADCQWYPIDIKVNEADLSIDFTLTAIKKAVNTGE